MADDKLGKVLSKLSGKDKEKAETNPEPEKEEKPKDVIQEEETEEVEETEEIEDVETEENEAGDQEVDKEEEPENQPLSEEKIKQLQELDNEISRLRDPGVFNAESLFQHIKTNENLERIASALEEIVNFIKK